MTTHAKGMGFAVTALLLVGSFLAAFPAKAEDVQTQVTDTDGPTDLLDGGDHRFIRFGADSAFGVVWGTEDHPNYVYLVALKARYLGVVDVYHEDRLVKDDYPLKVYTLYAVKLESLLEFQDSNADGIANFERRIAVDGRNFTTYVESEPLFKRVSLKTAWTPSEMIKTEDAATGRRTYEFSLTATNLSYLPLPNATAVSGVLDAVTFTFHLDVGVRHVDNHTVPQYSVTVGRGPRGGLVFTNATRAGETTWSGDVLKYQVKWDQSIVGWDFDAANTAKGVFLEMQALLAHRIPADREDWFDAAVLGHLDEGGYMEYNDGSAERRMQGLEGAYTSPRRIVGGNIALGGSWERVGRLTWVSNATVDGTPGQVYAQVLGGIPVIFRSAGAAWFGFGVLIGLSFPGGSEILHDPVQEADAFVLSTPSDTVPRFPVGLVLLLVIAAVGAVGAIVALQRKDKGKRLQEAYRQEPARNGQPQDWTKYYQR